MLTKEFKQSILERIDSPIVLEYIAKAEADGISLIDIHRNWTGKAIEQTLFLVLLVQNSFDYNHNWEDEMPWFELGWIFNIEHSWDAHKRFSSRMADNYQVLAQMDCEKRERLYPKVYSVFYKNP